MAPVTPMTPMTTRPSRRARRGEGRRSRGKTIATERTTTPPPPHTHTSLSAPPRDVLAELKRRRGVAPDAISYGAAISACAAAAQWERALALLDEVSNDVSHKDWRP